MNIPPLRELSLAAISKALIVAAAFVVVTLLGFELLSTFGSLKVNENGAIEFGASIFLQILVLIPALMIYIVPGYVAAREAPLHPWLHSVLVGLIPAFVTGALAILQVNPAFCLGACIPLGKFGWSHAGFFVGACLFGFVRVYSTKVKTEAA